MTPCLESKPRLFGSARRTEVLVSIALLEHTYAREIARVLGAPLLSVQRIVDALESDGILAVRLSGRERRMTLNPRYVAAAELHVLLLRLSRAYPGVRQSVAVLRRSPRKKGKAM